MMKRILFMSMVGCVIGTASLQVQAADVTRTVDPSLDWLGFMNVSELPEVGGQFVFGSGWGTVDLVAEFGAGTLTLSPNVIEDPNEFWYQNTTGTAPDPVNPGGPGQRGNKSMDANMYIEDDTLVGENLTFEGTVMANTFTAAHATTIFIRDFEPDYSSFIETTMPVTTPGAFSITMATDPTPGRHVQYGFSTIGENVWATDVAPFGSVVIAADSVGIPGDYDGDLDVDGTDFLVWQLNDGTSSGLTEWQSNYPTPPPLAGISAVPEPSSVVLAFLAAMSLGSTRRRSQS